MKKSILIICIMLLMMTTYAFAELNPNYLITKGYKDDRYMQKIDESEQFNAVVGQVTLLLGAAGIGVGTIVGIIYAIMWITATPSKKADMKERILPLVLGVILLFGGTGIAASFISGASRILQQ